MLLDQHNKPHAVPLALQFLQRSTVLRRPSAGAEYGGRVTISERYTEYSSPHACHEGRVVHKWANQENGATTTSKPHRFSPLLLRSENWEPIHHKARGLRKNPVALLGWFFRNLMLQMLVMPNVTPIADISRNFGERKVNLLHDRVTSRSALNHSLCVSTCFAMPSGPSLFDDRAQIENYNSAKVTKLN